ncbi:MAG: chemotaxis protein [Desulfovibrionaceae bacterium]
MAQSNILLESGTNELEVVEFFLDEAGYRGYYGINVAKVVEIIRPQNITATPQRPHPCVLGAFSYRDGRVVPIVDLNIYLGNPPVDKEGHKVIITEFNKVVTAFQVSGVNRIYRISWTDVEAPGDFLQASSKYSVTGVVRLDGRTVFLLDLEGIVGELHPAMALHMQIDAGQRKIREGVVRILHADDSGSVRRLIFNLLNNSGHFEVLQVADGQAAWELLEKLQAQADARDIPVTDLLDGVIADIEMPRLDGLTLCKQIKAHPTLKHLPVAIFSSLVTDSLKHRGESVGADVQYAKPDLQNLSDQLYDLIQQKKKARKSA